MRDLENNTYDQWIVTETKILEDGKVLEVSFKDPHSTVSRYTLAMPSKKWCQAMWAMSRLDDLTDSLKRTFKIVKGEL